MDKTIRKQSLLKFIESIEEKEIINKERKSESSDAPSQHDLPPINPQIVPEMAKRLARSAQDLHLMLCWLEKEMQGMSAHSLQFVDAHCNAVDEIATTTDGSVKAMYSLLSKAGQIQKDLTKVEMMSSHLKSINKYLERLDNTLIVPKSSPGGNN